MRRVLIVDDPRLAPRLGRLHPAIGSDWDVVIAPAAQITRWRDSSLPGRQCTFGSPAEVDSLIPTGEGVELVVAASSAESLAVASRLAFRRGSTVLVLPDGNQPADWVFSLYPLSEGAEPRVRGVFEHRMSTAVQAFAGSLPDRMTDRHLVCRWTVPAARLEPADWEPGFVEDVDLLRRLAGEFKNLIAVGVEDSSQGFRSLTLTFGGESSGTVTWTMQPGTAFAWELRQGDGQGPTLSRSADGEYSVTGGPVADPGSGGSPLAPWQDVLRTVDDLSAMRRSLRRRRLVELQTETLSERAQFKSLMSASGCGLLVATLFGAVALLAAGAAFDPRASLQRTSERAGLVLRLSDFQPGGSELADDAAAEWPGMVRRLSHTAAPILVEQSGDGAQDERRRQWLSSQLEQAGVASPASRIETYEFRGGVFLKVLAACWVLLFLPLGVFLIVQGLLLAAPVATGSRSADRT